MKNTCKGEKPNTPVVTLNPPETKQPNSVPELEPIRAIEVYKRMPGGMVWGMMQIFQNAIDELKKADVRGWINNGGYSPCGCPTK